MLDANTELSMVAATTDNSPQHGPVMEDIDFVGDMLSDKPPLQLTFGDDNKMNNNRYNSNKNNTEDNNNIEDINNNTEYNYNNTEYNNNNTEYNNNNSSNTEDYQNSNIIDRDNSQPISEDAGCRHCAETAVKMKQWSDEVAQISEDAYLEQERSSKAQIEALAESHRVEVYQLQSELEQAKFGLVNSEAKLVGLEKKYKEAQLGLDQHIELAGRRLLELEEMRAKMDQLTSEFNADKERVAELHQVELQEIEARHKQQSQEMAAKLEASVATSCTPEELQKIVYDKSVLEQNFKIVQDRLATLNKTAKDQLDAVRNNYANQIKVSFAAYTLFLQ